MNELAKDDTRRIVREQYGKIAESGASGCGCATASCCGGSDSTVTSMALGYSGSEIKAVPEGANLGLGCGNPGAIASLRDGETVLDLGSGAGFDCFLAAQEVGSQGRVIGVDMTPQMVSKARANADRAGYSNVEFRLGEIENLPVADAVVDVIISNCVINLSPEKQRVFKESYRVLKPGGRLAISDVVATAEMPEELKQEEGFLTGCLSGAAPIKTITTMLEDAGFIEISILPKQESKEFIKNWQPGSRVEDYVVSATIEARKSEADIS